MVLLVSRNTSYRYSRWSYLFHVYPPEIVTEEPGVQSRMTLWEVPDCTGGTDLGFSPSFLVFIFITIIYSWDMYKFVEVWEMHRTFLWENLKYKI
jgi:hypothetical protein